MIIMSSRWHTQHTFFDIHTILYYTIPRSSIPFHTIPHHNSLSLDMLCIASHRLFFFGLVWLAFLRNPSFSFLPSSLFYRILAQTASSSSSKHSVAHCNDLAQLIDWLTDSPTDRPACRAWRGDLLYSTYLTWPDLPYRCLLHCTTWLYYILSDLMWPYLTWPDLYGLDLTWPVLEWRDLYWVYVNRDDVTKLYANEIANGNENEDKIEYRSPCHALYEHLWN